MTTRGLWGPNSDNNTIVVLSTDNGPEEVCMRLAVLYLVESLHVLLP